MRLLFLLVACSTVTDCNFLHFHARTHRWKLPLMLRPLRLWRIWINKKGCQDVLAVDTILLLPWPPFSQSFSCCFSDPFGPPSLHHESYIQSGAFSARCNPSHSSLAPGWCPRCTRKAPRKEQGVGQAQQESSPYNTFHLKVLLHPHTSQVGVLPEAHAGPRAAWSVE